MTKTLYCSALRHWSILTKSRSGVVSVLRDLTLDEARAMYSRLQKYHGVTLKRYLIPPDTGLLELARNLDVPAPTENYIQVDPNFNRSDDDIGLIEVFGPPGWDSKEVDGWEDWPKIEYVPIGLHNWRRCPECGLETDAPEGSCVCPTYHGNRDDGETDHCPIWVDGETEAQYEARAKANLARIIGAKEDDAKSVRREIEREENRLPELTVLAFAIIGVVLVLLAWRFA